MRDSSAVETHGVVFVQHLSVSACLILAGFLHHSHFLLLLAAFLFGAASYFVYGGIMKIRSFLWKGEK